jgi:HSP20 family protein
MREALLFRSLGGITMEKRSKDVTVSKGAIERMPRPTGPFSDIDQMFDDFFHRRWMRPFFTERPFGGIEAFMPHVDVIDHEDEVVVRAEVPGYKKEDIEISLSDSSLNIRGEIRTEEKEEKRDYYCCEISHGAFSRTVPLPAYVDEAKAKASMKDGMLELTLPKVEKSKRHTINIV